MIGSHRLRALLACKTDPCKTHPPLIRALAAEVLASRDLQRALRNYFEYGRVRPSKDGATHLAALQKCLESLMKVQNEQAG